MAKDRLAFDQRYKNFIMDMQEKDFQTKVKQAKRKMDIDILKTTVPIILESGNQESIGMVSDKLKSLGGIPWPRESIIPIDLGTDDEPEARLSEAPFIVPQTDIEKERVKRLLDIEDFYAKERIKDQFDDPSLSPLGKLVQERDTLPEGSPLKETYESRIQKMIMPSGS